MSHQPSVVGDTPPRSEMPPRSGPKRLRKSRMVERIPAGAKLVTRGSRYGNPFRVELHDDGEGGHVFILVDLIGTDGRKVDDVMGEWPSTPEGRVAARKEAVERFREWINGDDPRAQKMRIEARENLKGRDLVCMCPLDEPCHGDVLIEVANGD